jgi:type I restriction enzyme S subunit
VIDIRPDHLRIVKSILATHVPDYKVLAFGSRVTQTAKEYSDLDLVVVSSEPLSPRTMALMKDDFSESDLPFKVDVLDWATTSDDFRKVIAQDCEVVQEGES